MGDIEDAIKEWYPENSDPESGPSIPPTTPRHPTTPEREVWIEEGEEDPDSPGHFHLFPAYLNGWCLIVWLVRTDPGKGGTPMVDPLPDEGQLLSVPPQEIINNIAKLVRDANTFLNQCENIAFRLCEIHILDVRRLHLPGGKKLSDTFDADGNLNSDLNTSNDFINTLERIMKDGNALDENVDGQRTSGNKAFMKCRTKVHKKCVHLFFVENVQDINNPDTNLRQVKGVGGIADLASETRQSSYAILDSQGDTIGKSIAHEIGHSLGLPHNNHKDEPQNVKNDPKNLMKPSPKPDDTNLQKSQCDRMIAYLESEYMDAACP